MVNTAIRRSLLWGILALAAGACSAAPPSTLPRSNVLRYGVTSLGGSVSFVVRKDGSAIYESAGGLGETSIQGRVSDQELERLAHDLTEHDCCSLVSSRGKGVPDEARPSFSVRIAKLDCTVTMWDNEFSESEDAKACLTAVEGLATSLRDRSHVGQ